jgi:Flp pilus assembly protein TadB
LAFDNEQIMGLILGIVMSWVGIIVFLASRPLAKGEVRSKDYNYRPWQPKFVKSLSDEEADAINRRYAGYAVSSGLLMSACGVAAIVLAVIGYGSIALLAIAVPILLIIGLTLGAFVSAYNASKRKAIDKQH